MIGAVYGILRSVSNPAGSRFNWDEKVASGLTWEQAESQSAQMQREYDAAHPGKSSWTSDLFIIEMEIDSMGNKVKSKARSNSDVQREMREAAAGDKKKAKSKPAQKGKKAPAKLKAKLVNKPQKSTHPTVGHPELISPAELREKKDSASALVVSLKSHLRQHFDSIDAIKTQREIIDAEVVALQKDSAWRFAEVSHEDGTMGPYATWKACVDDLIVASGRSRSLVKGIITIAKRLPELSSPERAAMGERKGRHVGSAAEEARKQGRELPLAIIESAQHPDTSEDQIISEIEAAGLAPKPETQVDDIQESFTIPEPEVVHKEQTGPTEGGPDPLLAKTATNTFPESPRKGGSGTVNGKSGEAEQYDSIVRDALDAAKTIYADSEDPIETDAEALKFICKQWLFSQCDREKYDDTTNLAAALDIKQEKAASAGV